LEKITPMILEGKGFNDKYRKWVGSTKYEVRNEKK
jgi:hypothetical protein